MTPAEVNEAAELLGRLGALSTAEAQIQSGRDGVDTWAKLMELVRIARDMKMPNRAATTIHDAFQAALLAQVARQRTTWTDRLAQLGVAKNGGAP